MATERIEIIIEGKDKASGALRGLQNGLGGIATVAGGILSAGIISKIGGAISGLASTAISSVGELQTLEIGLDSLIARQHMYTQEGDKIVATGVNLADAMNMASAETQQLLGVVEQLAIVSPFETKDVELVTKLGLGARFSVDTVDDLTKAFLDMAAGVGISSSELAFSADQFFQLKKAGKLTEIDLRQLRRMGIDVAEILGVKMGMSVDEFNERVGDSPELMDQLFESFIQFSGETFGGAAERMSQTIPGMMSTAQDLISVGSRKLFAPIAEAISPAMSAALDTLSSIATGPQIQAIGTLMGSAITNAIQGDMTAAIMDIGSIFGTLGASPETVQGIIEFLTRVKQEFTDFSTEMSTVLGPAGAMIADAFSRIGEALGFTSGNVSMADIAIGALSGTLDAIVIGVQAFAVGMQGLAGVIEFVAEKATELINTLSQLQSMGSAGMSILGPESGFGGYSALEMAGGAGGFASGGVVPGPLGSPQMAMVHSGETILPTHNGPMMVNVPVYLNGKVIAQAVGQAFGQQTARRAGTGAGARL